MHGCMTEYVVCNHPRADGRIAVLRSKSITSMVTVGSYMYVYDRPLADFIGSTLSMAIQCIFNIFLLDSIRQATMQVQKYSTTIAFSGLFNFWFTQLLHTFHVQRSIFVSGFASSSHVSGSFSFSGFA